MTHILVGYSICFWWAVLVKCPESKEINYKEAIVVWQATVGAIWLIGEGVKYLHGLI